MTRQNRCRKTLLTDVESLLCSSETQSSLQTPRPPGRFRVMLQSQKCDCGEYQVKHLPSSHVMTACKSVNVDPMNYVPHKKN